LVTGTVVQMQTLKDAVKQLQEELQHKDEQVRQNVFSYTRIYSLTKTHTHSSKTRTSSWQPSRPRPRQKF